MLKTTKDLRQRQQFKDYKYITKATIEWLGSKLIHILEWTTQSPDLEQTYDTRQDLESNGHTLSITFSFQA